MWAHVSCPVSQIHGSSITRIPRFFVFVFVTKILRVVPNSWSFWLCLCVECFLYLALNFNFIVKIYVYFFFFQRLCDYVCDLLLEESNVQPVSTPVTVCGDIHGQVTFHKGFIGSILSTGFVSTCAAELKEWQQINIPN